MYEIKLSIEKNHMSSYFKLMTYLLNSLKDNFLKYTELLSFSNIFDKFDLKKKNLFLTIFFIFIINGI